MKNDLFIQNDITIPEHELIITTSRSGGPGGQHVNKTNSKITIRWNIQNTAALNDEQKNLVLQNLKNNLTAEGDLIIHNSQSRSLIKNKQLAMINLMERVRNALYVPKKRIKTKIPKAIKEKRLKEKSYRSNIKKFRKKVIEE